MKIYLKKKLEGVSKEFKSKEELFEFVRAEILSVKDDDLKRRIMGYDDDLTISDLCDSISEKYERIYK